MATIKGSNAANRQRRACSCYFYLGTADKILDNGRYNVGLKFNLISPEFKTLQYTCFGPQIG